MRLLLTTKIWKEGKHYVAYTPELDIASQGKNFLHAEERLREAVNIFIEETKRLGTFEEVMRTSGFSRRERHWEPPLISIYSLEVAV